MAQRPGLPDPALLRTPLVPTRCRGRGCSEDERVSAGPLWIASVAAVVNDAVELTRRAGKSSAAGLVNAVLRAIGRDREHLPLPRRPATAGPSGTADDRPAQLDYLAVTLSHPRWLVDRWCDGSASRLRGLGIVRQPAGRSDAAGQFVETCLAEPGGRARRPWRERVPTRFAPDGLIVPRETRSGRRSPRYGLFFVQDEASQLVTLVTDAKPGEPRPRLRVRRPVGRRSRWLARWRHRVAGRLRRPPAPDCACSSRRSRLAPAASASFGGLPRGPPCRAVFDVVLVDAPFGPWHDPARSRHSLAAHRGRPGEIAATQQLMLATASEIVRPGGRLVYATCSSEPEENEEASPIAARFSLRIRRSGRIRPPRRRPSACRPTGRPVHGRGTPPHLHVHGLEAFFAAGVSRVTA